MVFEMDKGHFEGKLQKLGEKVDAVLFFGFEVRK